MHMIIKMLLPLCSFLILNLGALFADAESKPSNKTNYKPNEKLIQQKLSACEETEKVEPKTVFPTKKTIEIQSL